MSYKSDDEQLEERMRKLPKQKDNRSKDEVLKRLKQDERVKDTSEHPSPQKHRFPPFLVATAIVLLAILIPTLFSS